MIKAKKDVVKIKVKDFGHMMTEYIFITKSVKNALVEKCEMTEEEAWEEIERAVKYSMANSPIEAIKLTLDEMFEELFGEGEKEDE